MSMKDINDLFETKYKRPFAEILLFRNMQLEWKSQIKERGREGQKGEGEREGEEEEAGEREAAKTPEISDNQQTERPQNPEENPVAKPEKKFRAKLPDDFRFPTEQVPACLKLCLTNDLKPTSNQIQEIINIIFQEMYGKHKL